jgi:aspartyl-tRNA(Asn)/glutamyl-tRNA(Gln) amidotransferase subunit B
VVLAVQRGLDDLALAAVAAGGNAPGVLKHVEHNLADGAGALDATALAKLATLEMSGTLSATQAKTVLAELVEHGGDPEAIAAAKGFEAMDTGALEATVDDAITANADAWAKVLAGDGKAMGAITGYVMKATKGQADGKAVNQLLQQRKAAAS